MPNHNFPLAETLAELSCLLPLLDSALHTGSRARDYSRTPGSRRAGSRAPVSLELLDIAITARRLLAAANSEVRQHCPGALPPASSPAGRAAGLADHCRCCLDCAAVGFAEDFEQLLSQLRAAVGAEPELPAATCEQWVSVPELCDRLAAAGRPVPLRTLYRWVKSGKIPSRCTAGHVQVRWV